MDYSAAIPDFDFCYSIWDAAGILLLANVLSRKVKLVRKAMIPTSVLGGFIALLFRSLGILPMDGTFLNILPIMLLQSGLLHSACVS